MSIAHDEYKTLCCGIDGDECTDIACDICSKAIEEQKEADERELLNIITLQEKRRNGVIYQVNISNTILMTQTVDDVNKAINNNDFTQRLMKKDGIDPSEIERTYPHYKIFCEKNNIGAPWYYLYKHEWPLLAVYADKVIATAPQLDMTR